MATGLRWENCFIRSGDSFETFWKEYLEYSNRNLLFILGIGFDPRTNHGIKKIFSYGGNGLRKCIAIKYENLASGDNGSNTYVKNHIEELECFLSGKSCLDYKELITKSEDGKSVTSVSASRLISDADIKDFTDIVVDISAMPRNVFISLLNKTLFLIDSKNWNAKNLHVIVAENPDLDSSIKDRGIEEQMDYPSGFRIPDIATTKEYSRIWIPLLGEGQLEQFKIIKKEIDPVAICPVLPFPSGNIRRGDNLINYFQDYLFNDPEFEPNNIIYADEKNPFQVYRLLSRTIEHYHNTFRILGGCKIVISALSSKLLSIGAFLSAYEAKSKDRIVGIAHVESIDYDLESNERSTHIQSSVLNEIWLTGEPYNK